MLTSLIETRNSCDISPERYRTEILINLVDRRLGGAADLNLAPLVKVRNSDTDARR